MALSYLGDTISVVPHGQILGAISYNLIFNDLIILLGEGNFFFFFTGSWDSYLVTVGRQINNNILTFQECEFVYSGF